MNKIPSKNTIKFPVFTFYNCIIFWYYISVTFPVKQHSRDTPFPLISKNQPNDFFYGMTQFM